MSFTAYHTAMNCIGKVEYIVNGKDILSVLLNRMGDPNLLELKRGDNTRCAIMYFSGVKLHIYRIEA